jgi:hypothetical protein
LSYFVGKTKKREKLPGKLYGIKCKKCKKGIAGRKNFL